MSDTVAVGAEAIANAWLYTAVLLSVGVIATRWWLSIVVRRALPDGLSDQLERALNTLCSRLGLFVVGSFVVRGWTHALAIFGWEGATSPVRLQVVLGRSLWGKAWQTQMLVAAAFAVTALISTKTRRPSAWWLTTAWGLGLCAVLPLTGHSVGSPSREVLHGLHLFGSGLWLGTLTVVLIVSRSLVRPDGQRVPMGDVAPAFLSRFSPLAVAGVATLAFGGIGAAYRYLNSFSDLWTTTYGELLSAKIVAFIAAGVCGWLNWRSFASSDDPKRDHFRPVMIEIALAVAIVLVTSLLTELEHPFMD